MPSSAICWNTWSYLCLYCIYSSDTKQRIRWLERWHSIIFPKWVHSRLAWDRKGMGQGWSTFLIKRANIFHLHHQGVTWSHTSTMRKATKPLKPLHFNMMSFINNQDKIFSFKESAKNWPKMKLCLSRGRTEGRAGLHVAPRPSDAHPWPAHLCTAATAIIIII